MTTKPSPCSVPDCPRRVKARRLCELHYDRAVSAGTIHLHRTRKAPPGSTLEQRIRYLGWTAVDRQRPGVDGPCWEWSGARNNKGYGFLFSGLYKDGNRKRPLPILAPRAAYITWIGDLPPELVVRHRCDNPPCVNPMHLIVGTHADNSDDTVSRRRTATWNRRPHKLTDEQAEEVRRRYAAGGVTQRALAADFGVCQQLISHIVRRTRRCVPVNPPLPD